MHVRTIAHSLVLALVIAAGCDSVTIKHGQAQQIEARAEALAEAYCAAYTACDCAPLATDALHPDPTQCVAEQTQRLLAAFEQAERHELEFDVDCMDQLLARYPTLDCSAVGSIHAQLGNPTLAENFGCALYHGERDDLCEELPGTRWSDCDQGLVCLANACSPELVTVGEGEGCMFNASTSPLDCEAGLYCVQSSGCQPTQGVGEPCSASATEPLQCAPDLRCEASDPDSLDGTCVELLPAGEPCSAYECSGFCQSGICVDAPAVCLLEDLQPPA